MNGFGFSHIIDKLGVERRVMTSGENKNFLDPFSPMSEKHRHYAQGMINEIHAQFINAVKKGRGKRLQEKPDTFSGLIWTGEQGVKLGLADGFGSVQTVADDVVKESTLKNFSHKPELLDRIADQLGVALRHVEWKARSEGMRIHWN
jgi:protease-4